MRILYKLIFGICVIISPCIAEAQLALDPFMNKITLRLSSEQWVTTTSALVNVSVNAALTNQGLEKIQADVLQKLTQLSNKSQWHILSFDRQQDKTGLESVQIMAQARLPESDLASLRDKAKSLSAPGQAFSIDSIQFIPSAIEFQQTNEILRSNIYQQAKNELATLNKFYPEQKYYLHDINFLSMMAQPMAQNMMFMQNKAVAGTVQSPTMPVGNKLELQATVEFAAIPEVVLAKAADLSAR